MNDATSGSLLVLGGIYFLPMIVAVMRGHLSTLSIFLCNLFLGWTALGWIIALIWAASSNTKVNREIATFGKPRNTLGDAAEALGRSMKRR